MSLFFIPFGLPTLTQSGVGSPKGIKNIPFGEPSFSTIKVLTYFYTHILSTNPFPLPCGLPRIHNHNSCHHLVPFTCINFPWCLTIKSAMESSVIVILKVDLQTLFYLLLCLITFEVNIFIFHRTPKSLDKDIIQSTTLTIHTNRDLLFPQTIDKGLRGELAALVTVKDTGLP